jgi:beta-barrel assembly-enhancing protease
MMLTKLAPLRRLLYPVLSLCLVVSIVIGQTQVSRANWWEVLIQGAQYIQLANMSDGQEANMGAQINQQLSGQVKIYPNLAATSYVDKIGQRLARTSIRPNIKYTFQVVEDDAVNAFATMGGFVYINTGLLKIADNEAQLAGVMGHEIGHIAGRHGLQQMKQAALSQGLSTALGVNTDKLVQLGVQVALTLPNSRQDEYDADRQGLSMIVKTGYAPSAMPEFMKKLMRGNSPPEFLSSHPAVPERVANLQRMIPSAYKNNTTGLSTTTYKRNLTSFF